MGIQNPDHISYYQVPRNPDRNYNFNDLILRSYKEILVQKKRITIKIVLILIRLKAGGLILLICREIKVLFFEKWTKKDAADLEDRFRNKLIKKIAE